MIHSYYAFTILKSFYKLQEKLKFMKKYFFTAALLAAVLAVSAQNTKDHYFKLTREGFNKENALSTTAFVEKYFRIPGNSGFDASIRKVESILKEAGFVEEKANEREAKMTYRVEKRPMRRNTWEPLNAHIKIQGEATALMEFKTNRNMIAINSASTPEMGLNVEVTWLKKDQKIEDLDVTGKIVFSETSAGRLFASAMKAGAIGVMGYSMPHYTKPEIHQTSVQFSSIQNTEGKGFALNMSFGAKERLKKALEKGVVGVNVMVQAKSYNADELTIVANIQGSEKADERFVYSAHVQEPGANDNATGVATLAEMARLSASLVKSGKFNPKRTLTFLWGDEITSTNRYITEDTTRAKGILWGMSLDMVGENTDLTGGTFLLEKMPDPSAIWTRGDDKNSEWGKGNVQEKDLFPHYYNDFIYNITKAQGKHANWIVNFNPFEGGSDHTPFLRAKIPGLLMWHFTDVFYHTDNDRLDKVSATTMQNVGISALTAAMTLVNADENTALATVKEVLEAAKIRLKTEFELSANNINAGQPKDLERKIVETWGRYYVESLATINSMAIQKETTKAGSAIKAAMLEVEKITEDYLLKLK